MTTRRSSASTAPRELAESLRSWREKRVEQVSRHLAHLYTPRRERLGDGQPRGDARRAEAGGTVFTAATTEWPRVLAHGCPVVEQIRRNVIERAL